MPRKRTWMERMSSQATAWTGSSLAFTLAVGVILVWLVTGPIFGFSDTWQLVINTGTTIVTFLMVFLIQRSQNKDALAIQMKLNELVAAVNGASNRLINIEDLSEKDIQRLHHHYQMLVKLAEAEEDITCSHSVEEAARRHGEKRRSGKHPHSGEKTAAREQATDCVKSSVNSSPGAAAE